MGAPARGCGKPGEHPCAAGGGRLLRISDVASERQGPATNADVWPAPGSSNALYTADSAICEACWLAYLAPIDRWCRSLADPHAFRAPLAAALREFPVPRHALPRETVMYNQLYGAGLYSESIGYWYERDDLWTKELRRYSREHGLSLEVDAGPPERQGQVLVSASCWRRG
jgi:hypothetical protein